MNDFETSVYILCGGMVAAGAVCLWWNNRSFKRLVEERQKREASESYVERKNTPVFSDLLYSIASSSQDALRRTESAAKAVEASADRVERQAREQQTRSAAIDTTASLFQTDFRNPPSIDLASAIRKEEAETWKRSG